MADFLPWLSIGIASLALAINALTFMDRRRQDQRQLFLKMHERMLDPDLQRGRRIIHTRCRSVEEVEALPDVERDAANRALAMFDAFALCVEKNYVDADVAMAEWGDSVARLFEASEAFLAWRDRQVSPGRKAWPNFRQFGERAVAVRSTASPAAPALSASTEDA